MRALPLVIPALLWLGILVRAVWAPSVMTGPSGNTPQLLRDTTSSPVAFSPPVRHLADLQGALSSYLPEVGNLDAVAAITPTTRAQALHAGLGQIFPALAARPTIDLQRNRDAEALFLLHPDAIVVWRYAAASLRRLGLSAVFAVDGRTDVAAQFAAWRLSASLAGRPDAGRTVIADYIFHAHEVQNAVAGKRDVRAIVLFGGDGFWSIAGRRYYLNDKLALAGIRNVANGYLSFPQVDLERLLVMDPDVIFLNAQPGDTHEPAELYGQTAWQALRAVRRHRVYKMPRLAVFPGPVEQPLLLRWLAEVAHPELPALLRAQYRAAYLTAYGYRFDDTSIDHVIQLEQNAASAGYSRFAAH